MRKWFVFIVLSGLASPFILLSGYGLYYGYDVVAGNVSAVKLVTRRLTFDAVEQVADGVSLRTVRLRTVWNGDLTNETLAEPSGIAASNRSDDIFYSINDSGNLPQLFAFRSDGSDVAVWDIEYPGHHDFEDIARFRFENTDYLLIADTGDNFYWRRFVTLLIVKEPDHTVDNSKPIKPAWTINVQYADGPRDVEGVAVDMQNQQVLLVSKRRVPAEIFSVPLRPAAADPDSRVTAEPIALLKGIPRPTALELRQDPEWGKNNAMPTAFDLVGRSAVVITYKDAYLYQRDRRQSWSDAFTEVPVRILLPKINGLESGGFSYDADSLLVTGERHDGVARTGVFEVKLDL